MDWIPGVVLAPGIEKNRIVNTPPSLRIVVGKMSLPDDFILKTILSKNLIEHHLDVVARVPIAMVIKTTRLLEHSR